MIDFLVYSRIYRCLLLLYTMITIKKLHHLTRLSALHLDDDQVADIQKKLSNIVTLIAGLDALELKRDIVVQKNHVSQKQLVDGLESYSNFWLSAKQNIKHDVRAQHIHLN